MSPLRQGWCWHPAASLGGRERFRPSLTHFALKSFVLWRKYQWHSISSTDVPRIGPNLFRTQRKFSLNQTPKRNWALRAALNAPLSDRLGVDGKLQLLQTPKTGFLSQNGHLCLSAQYPLIKPLHVFLGTPLAATWKKTISNYQMLFLYFLKHKGN